MTEKKTKKTRKIKKTSMKTLIIFWAIVIPLLACWYFFLEWKNDPAKLTEAAYSTSKVLPLGNEYESTLEITHHVLQKDDVERNYLILLQNNKELRPGGGYIGSFVTATVKNGEIIESSVYNTSNFDERIPEGVEPPFPMQETIGASAWKFRDSNWMPDFPTNARVAEKFFKLGEGQEDFDAVIAINSSVLNVIFDTAESKDMDNYTQDIDVIDNAYQGKNGNERKVIIEDLLEKIISHVEQMSFTEKVTLFNNLIDSFDSKGVQFYFNDEKISTIIEANNWGGKVDEQWDKDYLMISDANLLSDKTDDLIERDIDYDVDLTGTIPQVVLKVHYKNNGTKRDGEANDYQTYMRAYVPANTWFTGIENCVLEPRYGDKYGKKYVGCLVHVPLGTEKTVTIRYNLPLDIKNHYPYNLKIQKQSGVDDVPVNVNVKTSGEEESENYNFLMNEDVELLKLK
ncbi:MAG: DUF4012 domain-containing protein [Patescibacteria group bacterium]